MSQPDSFAKCGCQHCGGHIEFPRHGSGRTIPCPHCGWATLLVLSRAAPVEIGGGRAARKRVFSVFAIGAMFVLAAAGGAYFFLRNSPATTAEPVTPATSGHAAAPVAALVAPPKPLPPPDPWHGLKAAQVTLEKTGDGRLVYAVGTLRNETPRQRFGVKVDLDVLDAHHDKIGSATDYTDVIEPGKEWKFKALVTDRTATAARLANVTEQ
jgi:hypothetical protein